MRRSGRHVLIVLLLAAALAAVGTRAGDEGSQAGIARGLYPREARRAQAGLPSREGAAAGHAVVPTASAPLTEPAATVAASTPLSSPAVLGAQSTPAPTPPQPTAFNDGADAPAGSCPTYPVLVTPSPDLTAATQSAVQMWNAYTGCEVFEMAAGGLTISYASEWPGRCLDPDIAACTFNGIVLSPVEPLYDAASVIAHELGHVLNYGHGEAPAIMDPPNWGSDSTAWCSLEVRCR